MGAGRAVFEGAAAAERDIEGRRQRRDAESLDRIFAEGLQDFDAPAPAAAPAAQPKPVQSGIRRLNPGEFVQNADGSRSTERLITINDPRLNEGRATNIPSVWNVDGKVVELPFNQEGQRQAIDYALRTGERWDGFNSVDEAVAAAKARSSRGGRFQDAQPQAQPAAPMDPRRRIVGNLARSGVRGAGRAAFGVSQQVQQQEDAIERAAMTALAKGDDLTYSHFARKLGKELVPPQLLQDARAKRLYAQGALVAEKLYKENPAQAHTFLQAYLRSGGNVEASLATAGQPYGKGLGRNQIVGYFDQNGVERAGIPMFGPDGRVVMQEVPGVSRLAPTGRRAGTGAAGMKPMTYGQARTRALAELRAAGDGYTPITPQQVEQRTRQILEEQQRAMSGEEPPEAPMPADEPQPAPVDEGPGMLERGWNWMFGGGGDANAAPAPQNGAPLPKPAPPAAAAPAAGAGRTRQYVPGQGFVDVMP